MNAEELFLHVIDSDETLTGEERAQMHVMMLRLCVYPHLEKMLEKQRLASAECAQERWHEYRGSVTPYQIWWAARYATVKA